MAALNTSNAAAIKRALPRPTIKEASATSAKHANHMVLSGYNTTELQPTINKTPTIQLSTGLARLLFLEQCLLGFIA